MDYDAELLAHPLTPVGTTDDGLREYESDLFVGDAHEVGVSAYARDDTDLADRALPRLRGALARIDALLAALPSTAPAADLARVTVFGDRVGLVLWEHGVNNEFTAVFSVSSGGGYRFDGFGDLFAAE